MKKLILLLMLSLGAGAVQAQVKFETKSTDAVREMARPAGKTGLHRPLCRLVSPVPDDGTGGVLAQGRGRIHGPAVRGRQIQHRQAHGPRTDEEIRRGSIPLYLVFDTEGELLGRITGAADAETFMDNLRTIVARQAQKNRKSQGVLFLGSIDHLFGLEEILFEEARNVVDIPSLAGEGQLLGQVPAFEVEDAVRQRTLLPAFDQGPDPFHELRHGRHGRETT